jgi:hypothetical protein
VEKIVGECGRTGTFSPWRDCVGAPPRKDLAADATVSPEGSGFSGITLSYNAKSEKEVDEVLEKVRGLGASVIKPAQKVYWGGYSGYFKDSGWTSF